MTSRLQNRRDTAANWTTNNPTLAAGEIGYETDTGKFKIGTGSDNWTTLGYSSAGTITSITAGTGLTGGTITSTGTIAIASSQSDLVIKGFEEDVNVVAAAATGTINLEVETASVWYYTTNATANHTLNIRYSSGVSLDTALAVGDAITVVWMNTNGATAYYPNVIQIDGTTVTPKIQGGTAIAAGNASSIDVYVFTIIKTAATPTYVVFESQTKFA
jgi:hypothetical protein